VVDGGGEDEVEGVGEGEDEGEVVWLSVCVAVWLFRGVGEGVFGVLGW